jgi:uncharacterized protein YhhL (DUF1145 family)
VADDLAVGTALPSMAWFFLSKNEMKHFPFPKAFFLSLAIIFSLLDRALCDTTMS